MHHIFKKYFENKTTAAFIALFAMLLWGSAIPMIKISYELLKIPPEDYGAKILLAGYRFFGSAILVFIYKLIFDDEKVNLKNIDYKLCFVIALVQISAQYLFYYIGLYNTVGVKAAVIQSSNPLIIVLLAHFLLADDKLNLKKIIAIALGIIAVIISNGGSSHIYSDFKLMGEGFILLATFCNALATVLMKKYGKSQNSYVVSIFQFTLGSLVLIVFGRLTTGMQLNFDIKSTLLLIYGSFISATAFLLWYLILKFQKAGVIGIFKLFVPIFGSLLSVVILKESYSLYLFIALLLTTFSTVFLNSNLMEKK